MNGGDLEGEGGGRGGVMRGGRGYEEGEEVEEDKVESLFFADVILGGLGLFLLVLD